MLCKVNSCDIGQQLSSFNSPSSGVMRNNPGIPWASWTPTRKWLCTGAFNDTAVALTSSPPLWINRPRTSPAAAAAAGAERRALCVWCPQFYYIYFFSGGDFFTRILSLKPKGRLFGWRPCAVREEPFSRSPAELQRACAGCVHVSKF